MTRPTHNLEVLYRAQGHKTWERMSRPAGFSSAPGHASSLVCLLNVEHVGGKRALDKGEFWAQVIVVQNFVSTVDVRYLPRAQVRYETNERSTRPNVTITGFQGDMPELPTQFRWAANTSPSFLTITTEREQVATLISVLSKNEVGEEGLREAPRADDDTLLPIDRDPTPTERNNPTLGGRTTIERRATLEQRSTIERKGSGFWRALMPWLKRDDEK
jgi:hypothetical protein